MFRFLVTGDIELRSELNIISSSITDQRDYWYELVRDLLTPELIRVFETDGYGTWPPRADALPHPLLRLTYALYKSIIDTPITDFQSQSLSYGTDIPYAAYHESENVAPNIPRRPIFGLLAESPDFDRRVGELLDNALQRHINRIRDPRTRRRGSR